MYNCIDILQKTYYESYKCLCVLSFFLQNELGDCLISLELFFNLQRNILFRNKLKSIRLPPTWKKLQVENICWKNQPPVQLAATCCFNLQQRNFVAWQCLRWMVICATTFQLATQQCFVASCSTLLLILLHLNLWNFLQMMTLRKT